MTGSTSLYCGHPWPIAGSVAQEWKGISPGAQTPSGVDWDGFRVDAGWCYRVRFESWLFGTWYQTYNRSGISHLYV